MFAGRALYVPIFDFDFDFFLLLTRPTTRCWDGGCAWTAKGSRRCWIFLRERRGRRPGIGGTRSQGTGIFAGRSKWQSSLAGPLLAIVPCSNMPYTGKRKRLSRNTQILLKLLKEKKRFCNIPSIVVKNTIRWWLLQLNYVDNVKISPPWWVSTW